MIKISFEKERIIKSLNELEKEYNSGNIPKRHYISQKRQLKEQLDTLEVANRVRKLQGKETAEAPVTKEITDEEEENEDLFKKYITSPGLKEKNIKSEGTSLNTKIAAGLLVIAFFIGIGFGVYTLNIPQQVSSASLFTNDTAFPPFILNNTTNSTNTTKIVKNTTKKTNTTVIPKNATKKVTPKTNTSKNSSVTNKAAGNPTTSKTRRNTRNYDPDTYDPFTDDEDTDW